MAIAGKSGRSELGDATKGPWNEFPRSTDVITFAVSLAPGASDVGVGPSHQVTTIRSVAPCPVGALLAISRLGKLLSRAPRMPSNVTPPTGSNCPHTLKFAIPCGRSNVLPPSKRTRKVYRVLACLRVSTLPEDVDRALAVGANATILTPQSLSVIGGGGKPLFGPGFCRRRSNVPAQPGLETNSDSFPDPGRPQNTRRRCQRRD